MKGNKHSKKVDWAESRFRRSATPKWAAGNAGLEQHTALRYGEWCFLRLEGDICYSFLIPFSLFKTFQNTMSFQKGTEIL